MVDAVFSQTVRTVLSVGTTRGSVPGMGSTGERSDLDLGVAEF